MKTPTDKAIFFDDWAAASAILNTGISQDKLLHILGVELPVWQKAALYWNQALSHNSDLAARYSELYSAPYQGKFSALQTKSQALDIDAYYGILCHTLEVQKHGIDFLSILEPYHNISYTDWAKLQTEQLNKELHICKNGTKEEQNQLQQAIAKATQKWETHWAAYYKNKNLDLTEDINF